MAARYIGEGDEMRRRFQIMGLVFFLSEKEKRRSAARPPFFCPGSLPFSPEPPFVFVRGFPPRPLPAFFHFLFAFSPEIAYNKILVGICPNGGKNGQES